MNEPVTKLHVFYTPNCVDRRFRVFFRPDPDFRYFEVGMSFTIESVNRQTGEVQFALEPHMRAHKLPIND